MFLFPASQQIKNQIESETMKLLEDNRFGDIVYEEVTTRLQRHGFAEETMEIAGENVKTLIEENLLPNILSLILLTDMTKSKSTFYQIPPLKRERASNKAVKLFDEPHLIDNECENVVRGVYNNLNSEQIRIKAISIRNLVIYTFWLDLKFIMTDFNPTPLMVDLG